MKVWLVIGGLAFAAYLYSQGDTLTANSPVGAKTGGGPLERIKLGWCNVFGGCS